MPKTLPLILIMALVTLAPAGAFSSFEFFGGAYHERISTEALADLGFSEESLHWIHLGNLHNDKFYRPGFDAGHHHFTEMDFDATAQHLEESLDRIVERAEFVEQDYQVYLSVLVEYGEYLHSVQDFYAHTNWVEQSVVRGDARVPLLPERMRWRPPGVVSPYFLYQVVPPGEVKDPSRHEAQWGKPFYTSRYLEGMEPKERILLTSRPQKALIHWELAKDDPDYPQSKLRWDEDSKTLFELAYEASVRDTRRQWRVLEDRLVAEYGAQGSEIAGILKSGWQAPFPEPSAPESTRFKLRRGEVEFTDRLSLRVSLTLEPDKWDQTSARRATEMFHRLVDPRGSKRFASEGLSELRFLKDSPSQVFRLSFQADLYGASRSFLTLRPAEKERVRGPWVARLSLPDELHEVEQFTFRTPGQVLSHLGPTRVREHKLVLQPPAQGWDPPDWVQEYLRDATTAW